MKKRLIFFISIFLYAFVLIICSSLILSKVKSLLTEYEAAQPEKTVEKSISEFIKSAKNNTIEKLLTKPKDFNGDFDVDSAFVKPYIETVAAGDLTYKPLSGEFEENAKFYGIFSGKTQIAKLKIIGTNERTKLLLFTCFDWKFDSIEPIVYNCNMTLPSALTVAIDGNTVSGRSDNNGNTIYSISSLSPINDIVVSDDYGKSITVDKKNLSSIMLKSYDITIPSNFRLSVSGKEISPDSFEKTDIEDFEYVREYIGDLPQIVKYHISCLATDEEEPDIKITNNLGKEIEVNIKDGSFSLTDFAKTDKIPDDIADQIDVLKYLETYSLFMTDDLSGKDHGFATISKYYIKDSYFYKKNYEWTKNVDITFTAAHTLLNPTFKNESVSNFVQYNENFFSCDVTLTKRMKLTRTGQIKEDTMSETIFIIRYDDTDDGVDNPKWFVVDSRAITKK